MIRVRRLTEETLNEIKDLLEDIKALLLLTNTTQLEETKQKLLEKNSIEEKVYVLCKNEIATKEISKSVQKTEANIRSVISSLRTKGLIKTIKKDDGTYVHLQRF